MVGTVNALGDSRIYTASLSFMAGGYMQSVTFAHREFRVIAQGVADVKFPETLGATTYDGVRVSGVAYAGKDNIDSFGVCS